jgi:FK506-binding nuclear protein
MQIGGEREIIVPPAMGYGARKMADIPANSTLIFGECFLYAMKVR